MPSLSAVEFLRPANWQDFESMVHDIYQRREWNLAGEVQRFGRSGQPQSGVDIVVPLGTGRRGIQCKRVVALTLADITAEVAKAEKFRPPLREFHLATTLSLDANLQAQVYELCEARREAGRFPVEVVFWETLCQWLASFPDLARLHYPQFVPSLDQLLAAQQDRFATEFPNLSVEERRSGRTRRVFLSGTGGKPIPVEFRISESGSAAGVEATLRDVRRFGGDVALSPEHVSVAGEPEFEGLMRELVAGGRVTSLRLAPAGQGQVFRGLVGIRGINEDHDMSMAIRRMRGERSRLMPADVRAIRLGQEMQEYEVVLLGLPITLWVSTGAAANVRIECRYPGRTFGDVLDAERALSHLHAGARVALFALSGDEIRLDVFKFELQFDVPEERQGLGEHAARIAQLAERLGVDLRCPEQLFLSDVSAAEGLLGMLQGGPRIRDDLAVCCMVSTQQEREWWIEAIGNGAEFQLSGTLDSEEEVLFGTPVRIPERWFEVQRAVVQPSIRERLVHGELPVEVVVESAPGSVAAEYQMLRASVRPY